jgi:hypothetical protein
MISIRSEKGKDDNQGDYAIIGAIHCIQCINIESIYTVQYLACAVQLYGVIP